MPINIYVFPCYNREMTSGKKNVWQASNNSQMIAILVKCAKTAAENVANSCCDSYANKDMNLGNS